VTCAESMRNISVGMLDPKRTRSAGPQPRAPLAIAVFTLRIVDLYPFKGRVILLTLSPSQSCRLLPAPFPHITALRHYIGTKSSSAKGSMLQHTRRCVLVLAPVRPGRGRL
jgi:hypothetical protein